MTVTARRVDVLDRLAHRGAGAARELDLPGSVETSHVDRIQPGAQHVLEPLREAVAYFGQRGTADDVEAVGAADHAAHAAGRQLPGDILELGHELAPARGVQQPAAVFCAGVVGEALGQRAKVGTVGRGDPGQ